MRSTRKRRKGNCSRANHAASQAAVVGDGVEIRPSRLPDAGFGIFATRDFSPGEIITKYEGKEISRQAAKKWWRQNRSHASHFLSIPGDAHRVVMGIRDPLVAMEDELGGGSFANDPDGAAGHLVNAHFRSVAGPEGVGGHAYLTAGRVGVKNDDEILVNYTAGGRRMMGLGSRS